MVTLGFVVSAHHVGSCTVKVNTQPFPVTEKAFVSTPF